MRARNRQLLAAGRAVLGHPGLWPTAARVGRRLVPPGWWRRWPPLPLPDAAYLSFRMETAYGSPDAEPDPHDVVAYLKWCRRWYGGGYYG